MSDIVPTIGRIVLYKVPSWQVVEINQRRKDAYARAAWHSWKKTGAQVHAGNAVTEGQVFPAMIVAVWGTTPTCSVNLKVCLDGSDTYWVTSVSVGDKPGSYHWMEYQKGQAAKTEAAEKALQGARNDRFELRNWPDSEEYKALDVAVVSLESSPALS